MSNIQQSTELLTALSRALDPEAGFSTEGREHARTFLTRGASWLADSELSVAVVQLTYAARIGVESSKIHDGALALELIDRSLNGLQELIGRDRNRAERAARGLSEELDLLQGGTKYSEVANRFRSLPNNSDKNIQAMRTRLEALVKID